MNRFRQNLDALNSAIRAGDISDALRLLLAGDININQNDENNPLYVACHYGRDEIARLLIRHGAEVNVTIRISGSIYKWTPLEVAAKGGRVPLVEVLLENGAAINAQDENGYTALHNASITGRLDVLRVLLAKGADRSLCNNDGFTPEAYARRHGKDDAADVINLYGTTLPEVRHATLSGLPDPNSSPAAMHAPKTTPKKGAAPPSPLVAPAPPALAVTVPPRTPSQPPGSPASFTSSSSPLTTPRTPRDDDAAARETRRLRGSLRAATDELTAMRELLRQRDATVAATQETLRAREAAHAQELLVFQDWQSKVMLEKDTAITEREEALDSLANERNNLAAMEEELQSAREFAAAAARMNERSTEELRVTNATLQMLQRESRTAADCTICLDQPATQVFFPCGHAPICAPCLYKLPLADGHRQCPMCRKPIVNVAQLFLV